MTQDRSQYSRSQESRALIRQSLNLERLSQLTFPIPNDWERIRYCEKLEPGWRMAAVLVPILDREIPAILLTKRMTGLSSHAGHVSFPGGRPNPDDAGPAETALREAFEETGLTPSRVVLAGCLPSHRTRKSQNLIIPVVGIVDPAATWQLQPSEVQEIIEFPFSDLLNAELPKRYEHGDRAGAWYWSGQTVEIWGATAAIMMSLATILRSADGGSSAHSNR